MGSMTCTHSGRYPPKLTIMYGDTTNFSSYTQLLHGTRAKHEYRHSKKKKKKDEAAPSNY